MDLLQILLENRTAIVTGLLAIVPIASMIVKMTPNEVDNKILDKFLDILNLVSLNNKNRK